LPVAPTTATLKPILILQLVIKPAPGGFSLTRRLPWSGGLKTTHPALNGFTIPQNGADYLCF
jgi:hypothetical protein